MKKTLKLQDHQHTAKRLEHKHTSYRGLFVILLIFGISLLVIQKNVTAQDYLVTAKISAPLPNTPAQIISPITGYSTDNPLVELTGNCPIINPAILIEITNNGQKIGTTSCSASGTFNIFVSLYNGENILLPKTINITEDYGPSGNTVNIYYNPPQTTPTETSPVVENTAQITPTSREQNSTPYLVVNNPFIVYNPSKEFTWTLDIAGGTSPYTVTIDWGDGQTETFTKKEPGKITISHRYAKASVYVVKVAITDVKGIKTIHEFSAITLVSQSQESVMGAIGNTKLDYMFNYKNLYAIYIFLVLLVLSFWYGAKVEQNKLIYANGPARRSKKRK